MQDFKKFIIRELLFTILVSFLAIVLFKTIFEDYYLKIFWGLLGIIALLTAFFHYSILQIKENETGKFTSKFMIFTGTKMVIYLVLITAYVFIVPENAVSFLISFFGLYLLYTVFEVLLIVKYLKKK